MPKIPIIPSGDFFKYLLRCGCVLVSTKGSHRKIINPSTKRIGVVPVHSGKDMPPGLFAKILKDLGIDIEEFLSLIKYH
jgi:predicted RNA binding protein YcfA (HicA-like mRNA interferase family)